MKRFQRTKEDFLCERCNTAVQGDGYTNHCPSCLWSKHVDINPGDRAEQCAGLMEPISAFQKHGTWRVVHRCIRCKLERVCSITKGDNLDLLAALAGTPR